MDYSSEKNYYSVYDDKCKNDVDEGNGSGAIV